MSNFRVGQRVVCVDDRVGKTTGKKSLVKDAIYTIKKIDVNHVYLQEIPFIIFQGKLRTVKYNANRFKPLQPELSNTTYDEVMQWIESGQPIEILN